MAEDDFRIKIGLDSTYTGGSAPTQGRQAQQSMATSVSSGLKMAGLMAILSQIKVVNDVVSVTLGLIGVAIVSIVGFLGGLFGQFLTVVLPFFKDPMKYLLSFGVFIVNGIITVIESGLNFVVKAINKVVTGINKLIPGEKYDIPTMGEFELPRLQEGLVLDAYDNYKTKIQELSQKGELVSSDTMSASFDFLKDLGNSFMKNSEFQEIVKQRQAENKITTKKALDAEKFFADYLNEGFNATNRSFIPAFDAMGETARLLVQKSNEVARKLGASGTGFTPSSANTELSQRLSQSTYVSEKEAKAGLYLLNKLGR